MLKRTTTTPSIFTVPHGFAERVQRARHRMETHSPRDYALQVQLQDIEWRAQQTIGSIARFFGRARDYHQTLAERQLAALERLLGVDEAPTRVDMVAVGIDAVAPAAEDWGGDGATVAVAATLAEPQQTHGFGTNLLAASGVTPFSHVRDVIVRTAGARNKPWVKYVLFEDSNQRIHCSIGHQTDRKHYELPPKGSAVVAAGYLYADLEADRLAFDGGSSAFPTPFDTILCENFFAAGHGLRLAELRSARRAYAYFQARLGDAVAVLPYSAASCLASPPEYNHQPENFAQREWWRLMRQLDNRTLQYVVYACPNGLLDYVVGAAALLDQLPAQARIVGGGRIQLAPNDVPTLHIDGEHDALFAAAEPDRLAEPYGLPAVAAYYRHLLGADYTVDVFADVTAIGTAAEERVLL